MPRWRKLVSRAVAAEEGDRLSCPVSYLSIPSPFQEAMFRMMERKVLVDEKYPGREFLAFRINYVDCYSEWRLIFARTQVVDIARFGELRWFILCPENKHRSRHHLVSLLAIMRAAIWCNEVACKISKIEIFTPPAAANQFCNSTATRESTPCADSG